MENSVAKTHSYNGIIDLIYKKDMVTRSFGIIFRI